MDFTYVLMAFALGSIVTFWTSWYFLVTRHKNDSPPTMAEMQETLQSLRDAITSYLLSDGVSVFSAIAKQKEILNNANRKAVAVFVSDEMFRDILVNTFQDQDSPYIDGIVDTFTSLEMPVAYLGELPVYVSSRLHKAPVYVCGEIEWSMVSGR